MTEPSVRRLTGADASDWQRLRLEALSTYPEAFLTTHDEAASVPLNTVAERLDAGHTFGVFQDAALVGIGSLIPLTKAQTKHRAEIGAFFVQPAAQGRGAAGALMDALATGAQQIGVRQLELYVAASNTRAIVFYTRAGFHKMGRIPNATIINGVSETDLIMVRELS